MDTPDDLFEYYAGPYQPPYPYSRDGRLDQLTDDIPTISIMLWLRDDLRHVPRVGKLSPSFRFR